MSLFYKSALDIAADIAARRVSAVDVVTAYLDRIDTHNDDINAIVWIDREATLAQAAEVDHAIASGTEKRPFAGVPMSIKDLSDVKGQPNTMSSRGMSNAPVAEDEPVVTALRDAGFVFLGRTNSPSFGALTTAENSLHGFTRNPWNLEFTPGGSSGGAAASVAAGFVPVASASDGGGSIRVPSSCNGLVGLKPSRGRVPARVRGWEHATTDGVITRTVADTAAILDVISHPDRLGWYNAPSPPRPFAGEVGADVGRLRIGLLLDPPPGMPIDAECVAAAKIAASALEEEGHEVITVAPTMFHEETILGFVEYVISSNVFAVDWEDVNQADPYIRQRYEAATELTAGDYVKLQARLQLESRAVVAQWGRDFDVLLTPSMACEPPRVGVVYDEANSDPTGVAPTAGRMVAFTVFANITGLPAISLPVHTSPSGLPVGAQLVAGPWDEATLIRLASALERRFAWQEHIAPVA